jgi:hypothetical protein
MHEQALRTILLIQAIEESDTQGELLPLAQRAAATQNVVHGDGMCTTLSQGTAYRAPRGAPAWAPALARTRHEELLAVAGGSGSSNGLRAVALIAGVLLAVLDGRGYLDILRFALLGRLAWNLLVYALLIANRVRPRALRGAGVARLYARWMARRADSVLRRAA